MEPQDRKVSRSGLPSASALASLLLPGLAVLICLGPAACDPNRNPADTDTNLVGIFDPNDQDLPVAAMVDLHQENQAIAAPPIRMLVKSILAEAVLADLALLDYPEEGTCEVFDEIVGRALVVPTNILDGGESLELTAADQTIVLDRELELNPSVNPGFYLAVDTDQICLEPLGCIPAKSSFLENTQYDFRVPGGPSLPAGDFPGAVFTPSLFTLTEPDVASEIVVTLPSPPDLEIQWDPPNDASDAFTIRIIKPDRTKLLYCMAADTGSFTIPGAKLAALTAGRYVFMASRTKETFFRMISGHRTLGTASVDWAGFLRVK